MANLDDIIDRHKMVKPEDVTKALTNVAKSFDESYLCTDGFSVVYNQVRSKALYFFPKQAQPLEVDISPEQRNYFVRTKYWQQL